MSENTKYLFMKYIGKGVQCVPAGFERQSFLQEVSISQASGRSTTSVAVPNIESFDDVLNERMIRRSLKPFFLEPFVDVDAPFRSNNAATASCLFHKPSN
jgi:hypothetical protein